MGNRLFQHGSEALLVEDVVPQHQAHAVLADELRSHQHGVCDATGHQLDGVGDGDPPLTAISQQRLEYMLLAGGHDDQDLPNTGLYEDGYGIVDQRLIVHRQQRFADRTGHGVQAGAFARSQNDTFHMFIVSFSTSHSFFVPKLYHPRPVTVNEPRCYNGMRAPNSTGCNCFPCAAAATAAGIWFMSATRELGLVRGLSCRKGTR